MSLLYVENWYCSKYKEYERLLYFSRGLIGSATETFPEQELVTRPSTETNILPPQLNPNTLTKTIFLKTIKEILGTKLPEIKLPTFRFNPTSEVASWD